MSFLASVNGHVTTAAEARVSVLDTGFTFGDAVYEVVRTYGRRPFALDRHLARLRTSAARLGIEAPPDDLLAARIADVLERVDHAESYIRLILSRGVGDCTYDLERVQGPTVVVIVKPYEPPPESAYRDGVPVVISSVRRNHPAALDPGIKSQNLLNNVMAVRDVRARGGFEPILLHQDGRVAEGASSNVFIVKAGRVATPPLATGILPGVTRAVVLEVAATAKVPLDERDLWPEDLRTADEAFITSTLKELCPVASVDGVPIGRGIGPLTATLLAAFRSFARRS